MKPYGTKLIEITEKNAEAIAKQWYNNVKMNPKTPAYHTMPEHQAMKQALGFYENFSKLFFTDKPFEEAHNLFSNYAEERYKERIPLPQVVYALILMRRHMWLYAEYQVTFITAIEHHHAAETLSRTILMFDYAIYAVTLNYDDLFKKEVDDKFKAVKVKNPFDFWKFGRQGVSGELRRA